MKVSDKTGVGTLGVLTVILINRMNRLCRGIRGLEIGGKTNRTPLLKRSLG